MCIGWLCSVEFRGLLAPQRGSGKLYLAEQVYVTSPCWYSTFLMYYKIYYEENGFIFFLPWSQLEVTQKNISRDQTTLYQSTNGCLATATLLESVLRTKKVNGTASSAMLHLGTGTRGIIFEDLPANQWLIIVSTHPQWSHFLLHTHVRICWYKRILNATYPLQFAFSSIKKIFKNPEAHSS